MALKEPLAGVLEGVVYLAVAGVSVAAGQGLLVALILLLGKDGNADVNLVPLAIKSDGGDDWSGFVGGWVVEYKRYFSHVLE